MAPRENRREPLWLHGPLVKRLYVDSKKDCHISDAEKMHIRKMTTTPTLTCSIHLSDGTNYHFAYRITGLRCSEVSHEYPFTQLSDLDYSENCVIAPAD